MSYETGQTCYCLIGNETNLIKDLIKNFLFLFYWIVIHVQVAVFDAGGGEGGAHMMLNSFTKKRNMIMQM